MPARWTRGRELAKRNIAAFERSGADVYVINAAGCGSALKEYGAAVARRSGVGTSARVAFRRKVRDIAEYLDEIGLGRADSARCAACVTYQDPCHLAHAQRITAAPRRLLAQIPGLEIREMRESSLCCGSAGIYNVTQPEMAGAPRQPQSRARPRGRARDRRDGQPRLRAADAQRPRRAGRPAIAVKHVVELLDESLAAGSHGPPSLL